MYGSTIVFDKALPPIADNNQILRAGAIFVGLAVCPPPHRRFFAAPTIQPRNKICLIDVMPYPNLCPEHMPSLTVLKSKLARSTSVALSFISTNSLAMTHRSHNFSIVLLFCCCQSVLLFHLVDAFVLVPTTTSATSRYQTRMSQAVDDEDLAKGFESICLHGGYKPDATTSRGVPLYRTAPYQVS